MRVSAIRDLLARHYRLSGLRSWSHSRYHFDVLLARMGDVTVAALTVASLEDYRAARVESGAARQTVNNELALLRRGLNLAHQRGLIRSVPRVPLFPASPARSGFLKPLAFARLAFALEVLDRDIADVVRFLYGLGWRLREVLGLRWDEADPEDGTLTVPGWRLKGGAARTVRLSGELLEILRRRAARRGAGELVFHRHGRPIRAFRRTWRRACEAVGKAGLMVHDLRRSFARNAIQAGVPQGVVMQIGGWRTASVFQRYAIVDEEQISEAIRKVAKWTEAEGNEKSEVGG